MINLQSEQHADNAQGATATLPPPDAFSSLPPPHDSLPPPDTVTSIWKGWEGASIMGLGVILPAVTLSLICATGADGLWHAMLRFPFETGAQFLTLIAVPISNLLAWSSLCKGDARKPLRMGLLNGYAAGASLLLSLLSAAALAFTFNTFSSDNEYGFRLGFSALVLLLASGVGFYLSYKLRRSKATSKARSASLFYTACGVLLSLLAVACCQIRSAAIRYAEFLAMSESKTERAQGLEWLRTWDPELDLRLQCSDPRSTGLAGFFFRLDPTADRQLYFAATGKPYHDAKDDNMLGESDEFLNRNVIGEHVPGFSMVRSSMTGDVSASTLSSEFNWTFVLKNKNFIPQEGRAELQLPAGAVVSGLTLWMNGEPKKAAFGATRQAAGAYRWVTVSHRDPALVTDLGRGRVLIQCSPVPAQGEMKVRLDITSPLKIEGQNVSTTLPRFLNSNFGLSGDNSFRIHSATKLDVNINAKHVFDAQRDMIVGSLPQSNIAGSNIVVSARHEGEFKPVIAVDPQSPAQHPSFIVETVRKLESTRPTHLVVVLDGSKSVRKYAKDIATALKKLPDGISGTLMVAGDNDDVERMPLAKGIAALSDGKFKGGRDDLQAVIKAAEEAGEQQGGAVLWVHGPQPSLNEEMYIMAPYVAAPSFYELAVDDGWTNLNNFLKNHREIGPFTSIGRTGVVSNDIARFLEKWAPGSADYALSFGITNTLPKTPVQFGDNKQQHQVASLYAAHLCDRILRTTSNTAAAEDIGTKYSIVTPVTAAVVLERSTDYTNFGLKDPNNQVPEETQQHLANNTAPQLQGAANGTIGPQATDATVINGINTSGTVRVNNIANLEALLNLIANGIEILGLGYGIGSIGIAIFGKNKDKFRQRIGWGLATIAIGLYTPGIINWLVGSARDANLFS